MRDLKGFIMKIGIVTINDHSNYGNRLQNYAVCRLLRDYGCTAETITVYIKEDQSGKKSGVKRTVKKALPCRVCAFISGLNLSIKAVLKGNAEADRRRVFYKFTKMHIPQKKYYVKKYEDLKKVKELKKYDYVFVGSDQVWNPYFAGNDYYFLTFVPPEKRIGFIASIGTAELPDEQKSRYTLLLGQMKYISVREESAVRIIEELIQKKVDCFLDPVLLLKRKDWEKLIRPAGCLVPEKYVLSFFLGEEPCEEIKSFAGRYDLNIIHMNQKKYKEFYLLGPDQLLFMIKNAAVVMTDSFHVTAFSILFQKQFYVFRRKDSIIYMENMFSRMESLLGKLNLMERIQNERAIVDKEDISMEKYVRVEAVLEEERKRLNKVVKDELKKEAVECV